MKHPTRDKELREQCRLSNRIRCNETLLNPPEPPLVAVDPFSECFKLRYITIGEVPKIEEFSIAFEDIYIGEPPCKN